MCHSLNPQKLSWFNTVKYYGIAAPTLGIRTGIILNGVLKSGQSKMYAALMGTMTHLHLTHPANSFSSLHWGTCHVCTTTNKHEVLRQALKELITIFKQDLFGPKSLIFLFPILFSPLYYMYICLIRGWVHFLFTTKVFIVLELESIKGRVYDGYRFGGKRPTPHWMDNTHMYWFNVLSSQRNGPAKTSGPCAPFPLYQTSLWDRTYCVIT